MPSRDPSPPDATPPPSTGALVERILDCQWSGRLLGLIERAPLSPASIRDHLPRLSAREMNERLRELTRLGIVQRTVVSDAPPIAVEYSLTPFGSRLTRLLAEARQRTTPRPADLDSRDPSDETR